MWKAWRPVISSRKSPKIVCFVLAEAFCVVVVVHGAHLVVCLCSRYTRRMYMPLFEVCVLVATPTVFSPKPLEVFGACFQNFIIQSSHCLRVCGEVRGRPEMTSLWPHKVKLTPPSPAPPLPRSLFITFWLTPWSLLHIVIFSHFSKLVSSPFGWLPLSPRSLFVTFWLIPSPQTMTSFLDGP